MNFFEHDAGKEEASAMWRAVMTGDLTTGRQQQAFADALKMRFGFKNLALCNSGTSALHLALVALGVGPGDEVITTPFTGIWTINPILMVGAKPVFADINRWTYNIDPDSVAALVTERTKVVMPVSVNAVPVDYKALRAKVPAHIRIVSDDIEALASTRDGEYVGADVGDDVSVGGFWVSKQVTTCSGGMVVSGDADLIDRCVKLARHGHGVIGDMWEPKFGYNYAFPDPLAAFGLAQLARLGEKQDRLGRVFRQLDECFRDLRKQVTPNGFLASLFAYIIELPDGMNKRAYHDQMARLSIPTRPYFVDLTTVPHLQPYQPNYCPVSAALGAKTMALPFHANMTREHVQHVAIAHEEVMYSLGFPTK